MKLSGKFTLQRGVVYLTGIQALVRLPIDQMRRDRRSGLNTGAFISGYERSPLGGYDLALGRVRELLRQHNIHFQPGVNEDLAATSVMGSQIIDVLGASKVDGVVGLWYGKGPGVDRSGDIFRHANLAGTGWCRSSRSLSEVNMRRMDAAPEIAAPPDRIRGYERIEERSVEMAKRAAEEKLAALEAAALAASAR
jgi:hypothetical protein